MKDRLVELLLKCDKENEVLDCVHERPKARQSAEIIADHLLANGVIVLPCKVGDTVYRVAKHRGVWEVLPREVVFITYRLDHLYRVVFDIFSTEYDRLGKTVFLTREEAEKALERRKG